LGWARTVDSHERGIADPKTFGVVVEGLLPAISPHPRRKLLSPATPKASIIHQTHCVSHCCRASPRTASLRSTHCQTAFPTRKRPRNALPTHWVAKRARSWEPIRRLGLAPSIVTQMLARACVLWSFGSVLGR